MQFDTSEFLIETIVPKNELIISRTDLNGNITYANETFSTISGYSSFELIGKPHNLVRHPDMPSSIFKQLWEALKTEGKWSGYIKNLRKDTGYYWVFANISGVYRNEKLVEYKSIRRPVTFEEKVEYQKKYDELRKQNNEKIRIITYS